MKKWTKILLAMLMVGVSAEISTARPLAYSYDIKDEFRFSDRHSFNIVKNDEKAEATLEGLKKIFDEVDDVEIKLEKTGSEGLDIFMAYYTGRQAESLNEIYWNAHDPTYEAYWNGLVEDLRNISKQIKADVGDYYGVGITINVSEEEELLLLVTGGLVMQDHVNAMNYDANYIELFK